MRALFNVCRHRGALVCREREGNARQFHCMYHGWTYNTDGSVKGIPGRRRLSAGLRQAGQGPDAGAAARALQGFLFRQSRPRCAGPAHLSRRRQGLHRPRRRPVAVRQHGNHFRHAGIRHQGELEAAGREQRRRLSPRHHAFDLAQLHAQLRRQHHAAQGPHAADQGLRQGPRQRPSHHRQSELSRPPGGALDFGVTARTPRPTSTRSARSWSTRLGEARAARVADTNRNLVHLPQSRHQRRLVGDGAQLHAGRARPDARHRLGARPGRGDRGAARPAAARVPHLLRARRLRHAGRRRGAGTGAAGLCGVARGAVDRSVARHGQRARSSSPPTRAICACSGASGTR